MPRVRSRQFETFNDGVVKIFGIAESGEPKTKPEVSTRFSNRIVGEVQFFEAKAADVEISRRIRIPMYRNIDEDNKNRFFAEIEKKLYKIERAQSYQDMIPPCTDLTLNFFRER
ncbi:MAG: hypothetical protein HDQ97_19220 [Lachnospiraceae bacterium]|nr:hypothetical protein [Lachnospiraceae bacterium]